MNKINKQLYEQLKDLERNMVKIKTNDNVEERGFKTECFLIDQIKQQEEKISKLESQYIFTLNGKNNSFTNYLESEINSLNEILKLIIERNKTIRNKTNNLMQQSNISNKCLNFNEEKFEDLINYFINMIESEEKVNFYTLSKERMRKEKFHQLCASENIETLKESIKLKESAVIQLENEAKKLIIEDNELKYNLKSLIDIFENSSFKNNQVGKIKEIYQYE